jgi:cytidylate kinase
MAKITIFGLAGTGKTTTGKLLCETLGYKYMSTGNIFRAKAEELGLSLADFEELCQKDSKYDIELDKMVEDYGKTEDDFVFESRLAWHFIPDSYKIKLDCPFDVRVARVAERENKDVHVAEQETLHREEKIRTRYDEYYGIKNFDADENFDLVVDTQINNAESVKEIILFELKNKNLI